MSKCNTNSTKANATKLKAGKRKCRRCKKVYFKQRGVQFICKRCRAHCSRCDVLLTDENKDMHSTAYRCHACVAERQLLGRDKPGRKEKARDSDLLRKYGITSVEYEAILKVQNGRCWICEKLPGKVRLHVDHEHVKNDKKADPRLKRTKVRGLLCWRCNNALGKFKDESDILRKAAAYLEVWPAQVVLKEKSNG